MNDVQLEVRFFGALGTRFGAGGEGSRAAAGCFSAHRGGGWHWTFLDAQVLHAVAFLLSPD